MQTHGTPTLVTSLKNPSGGAAALMGSQAYERYCLASTECLCKDIFKSLSSEGIITSVPCSIVFDAGISLGLVDMGVKGIACKVPL